MFRWVKYTLRNYNILYRRLVSHVGTTTSQYVLEQDSNSCGRVQVKLSNTCVTYTTHGAVSQKPLKLK